jgi:hypothetical protein
MLGRELFHQPALWERAAVILVLISAGAAVYLVACVLMRVDETTDAMGILRRKLLRPRAGA